MPNNKQGERSVQRRVRRVCATCDCWEPKLMQCRAAKGHCAPPESTCRGWILTRRRDFWYDRYHQQLGPISSAPRPGEAGAEDEAYERWMEQLAETCQAERKPCEGCQQGGICDGPNPDSTTPVA